MPSIKLLTRLRIVIGLERGSECYCGDDPFPIDGYSHLKLDDESCQTHLCPGENYLYCGGNDAISLYSTGIKKSIFILNSNYSTKMSKQLQIN